MENISLCYVKIIYDIINCLLEVMLEFACLIVYLTYVSENDDFKFEKGHWNPSIQKFQAEFLHILISYTLSITICILLLA